MMKKRTNRTWILDWIDLRDLAVDVRLAGLMRRMRCRTLGEVLDRGEDWRQRRPGFGERSEEKLRLLAEQVLDDLDPAEERRFAELSQAVERRPEEACRRLHERRRGGCAPREGLFNRLALKALEAVGLDRLLGLTSAPAPARPIPPSREGSEPLSFFEPRNALGVQISPPSPPLTDSRERLAGDPRLDSDKRSLLEACEDEAWAGAERRVYSLASDILPARRWSPQAAGRLVPSWVLCRRLVESTTGLLLRRRAKRCGWDCYRDILSQDWRELQPGHDEVGEKALWEEVERLVRLGPGWPLSTSTLAREATFEEAFLGSLERLDRRSAHILRLRLAVGRPKGLILAEAGNRLGLSAERVRQIEEQAWESIHEREAWPRRLRHRLRQAMREAEGVLRVADLTDDWLTGRAVFARPFFDRLVRRLMGRSWRFVLRSGEVHIVVRR